MDTTQVKEVMSDVPYAIEPSSTLRVAAKVMEKHECGALPVCDENGKLCGIVTDRDMVIVGIADDKDPDETAISEIMSSPVYTCTQTETLAHAADVMSEQSIRRLVVLDKEDGNICGIISTSDMIKCADRDVINDEILHHLFKYA